MKVLFFSYAYPNAAQPTLGTFNRSLLEAMARQHEVRVIAPVSFIDAWRTKFAGKSALDGNYAAIPGVTADYVPFYYPPKLFRDRFDEFLWRSVHQKLTRTIREFRPDVILSYWAHPDGAVAVRAGREHGIPVVTMVGGSDVLLLARSGKRRAAILNALRQADAVVAVSRHLAETLERDGLPSEKLHVIHRGIDREIFHPGDRLEARRALGLPMSRFTLVTVGRMVPVKGHRDLIEACARLHREGHTFASYILGDGPLRGPLQRDIQRFGLENTVELKNSQPQAELARWYRAADVAVLPSLSEGIPNVLLESLACGTPFIASNVGGIPDIADSRCDTLVPPENAETLADAIRQRLLRSRSPRPRGGNEGASDSTQIGPAPSFRSPLPRCGGEGQGEGASHHGPGIGAETDLNNREEFARFSDSIPPLPNPLPRRWGEGTKPGAGAWAEINGQGDRATGSGESPPLRRFLPASWDASAEALCDLFDQIRGASRSRDRQTAATDNEPFLVEAGR